ncbi:MAG: YdcF family protein [Defluviicoccus sp.]
MIVGKALWLVARPGNMLLLLLAIALVALAFDRRRFGGRLLAGTAAVLVSAAVLPVGTWLIQPLEGRFPAVLPARVDGIVVLGGSIEPTITEARGQITLNDSAERLTTMVALAQRYPDARVIFSGGAAAVNLPPVREADLVRTWLEGLGLAVDRVVFERDSATTYENALFSARLAEPKAGETWLLVTSAWHMPRAVGVFRAVDWPVVPYPVDFRTPLNFYSVFANLILVDWAVKEYVGLVAYRLSGRSAEWFPAPAQP